MTLLKRKVAELERDLAETRAKLARKDDGSLFDFKHDSAGNIVAAIIGNIGPDKAATIGKGLDRGRQAQAGAARRVRL